MHGILSVIVTGLFLILSIPGALAEGICPVTCKFSNTWSPIRLDRNGWIGFNDVAQLYMMV